MNDRFFLDTNIFVYSFDLRAHEKSSRAKELITEALATGKGMISFQVVQEFFNVALRRFSTPLTAAEAGQYLGSVFRPLLAVHSSPALYSEALRLCESNRLSWYDSLIVSAAIQGGCDRLFSEDLQHGQRFGTLTVEDPFR